MRRLPFQIAVLAAVAVALTGCGQQSKQYAASSKAKTYFTVPSGWHEISEKSLTAFEKKSTPAGSAVPEVIWQIAFTPLKTVKVSQVYSIETFDQPVVVARVRTLSPSESQDISYNKLREILLPVNTWINSPEQAPPDFKIIDDYEVYDQGVRGVRTIFGFTRAGANITFDQVAMVSNDRQTLYVLLSRCNADCYTKNRSVIDNIFKSFTVKGKK